MPLGKAEAEKKKNLCGRNMSDKHDESIHEIFSCSDELRVVMVFVMVLLNNALRNKWDCMPGVRKVQICYKI